MKKTIIMAAAILYCLTAPLTAQTLQGVKIYLNPGHGGYNGANDRNIIIHPFAAGDSMGFWESKANIEKGLFLKKILEKEGATVKISRTLNREVDDRNLTEIAQEANAFGGDMFLSIHSNASNGNSNFPLMLYRGTDDQPDFPVNKTYATKCWEALIANTSSSWTFLKPQVRGDISFYDPSWNGLGVLRPLSVPGMLSEGSFHDYIPETYRLMSIGYKKMEAWHFLDCFIAEFGIGKLSQGRVGGWVKDAFEKIKFPTNYIPHANSNDLYLPIHKATISLYTADSVDTGRSYTTDELYNGFYFIDSISPGAYKLKIEADKYTTKWVDITIEEGKTTFSNNFVEKDMSAPPFVLDHTPAPAPGEKILANSPIVLTFSVSMDKTSTLQAFSITPNIEGDTLFDANQQILTFTPKDVYQKGTQYKVLIEKSAQNMGSVAMEEDFELNFTTQDFNRLDTLAGWPAVGINVLAIKPDMCFLFKTRLNGGQNDLITLKDPLGTPIATTITYNSAPAKVEGSLSITPKEALSTSSNLPFVLSIKKELKDVDGLRLENDWQIPFYLNTNGTIVSGSLLADFEAPGHWSVNATKSKGTVTGNTRTAPYKSNNQLIGTSCYRLFYNFEHLNAQDPGIAYMEATTPIPIHEVENKGVVLHVRGDLSYNEVHLVIEQNSVLKELFVTRLDFYGYKACFQPIAPLFEKGDALILAIIVKGTGKADNSFILLDDMMLDDFTSGISTEETRPIHCYPNPATDHLFLELNDNTTSSIELFDLTGKKLLQKNELRGKTQISVQHLNPGQYILLTHQGEHLHRNKILIR